MNNEWIYHLPVQQGISNAAKTELTRVIENYQVFTDIVLSSTSLGLKQYLSHDTILSQPIHTYLLNEIQQFLLLNIRISFSLFFILLNSD